jgi:hypothetical protein
MRNTWAHSAVVVVAGIVLVAFAVGAARWATGWTQSIAMFSLLAPGLSIGVFTRRHPLVVGALCGAGGFLAVPPRDATADGTLAAALAVAVAALAGRALRRRYDPAHAPSPAP